MIVLLLLLLPLVPLLLPLRLLRLRTLWPSNYLSFAVGSASGVLLRMSLLTLLAKFVSILEAHLPAPLEPNLPFWILLACWTPAPEELLLGRVRSAPSSTVPARKSAVPVVP